VSALRPCECVSFAAGAFSHSHFLPTPKTRSSSVSCHRKQLRASRGFREGREGSLFPPSSALLSLLWLTLSRHHVVVAGKREACSETTYMASVSVLVPSVLSHKEARDAIAWSDSRVLKRGRRGIPVWAGDSALPYPAGVEWIHNGRVWRDEDDNRLNGGPRGSASNHLCSAEKTVCFMV